MDEQAMLARSTAEFVDMFREFEDPRQDGKVSYPLHEVLFLVIVGVLCGQESWSGILDWGAHHLFLLRRYFIYEHGLPSESTLVRVMSCIDARQMESWLSRQAQTLVETLSHEQVMLDGKALRGKRLMSDTRHNSHIVNVFASQLGIVLAQRAIPEKSGELTAMRALLADLEVSGALVSIDAIACHSDIAERILSRGGDYLLALKANQNTLYQDVQALFASQQQEIATWVDKGHGRLEQRQCEVLSSAWLAAAHPHWPQLTCCIKTTHTRCVKGQTTVKTRYYLSSRDLTAEQAGQAVRRHWCIENQLHWVLDVQFGEDACLIRKDQAAENMAAVRKMVLNIVKQFKTAQNSKRSINRIRQACAWDYNQLCELINSWIQNSS